MADFLQPGDAPVAVAEGHLSFSPPEASSQPMVELSTAAPENADNGLDTASYQSGGPVPAGRRRSSFIRTKSGTLIDGTHIGQFEEDVELQSGKPAAAAFDMTLFMEKLRAEDEASGAVRDVSLTWGNVTIMGTKAGTQEGIPVFWEPFKKIAGIPGKIVGGIKAKKAAKAAAAAGTPIEVPNAEKIVLNDCSGFCKGGEVRSSCYSALAVSKCSHFLACR
jgi:hypothetical protein